MFGRLNTKQAQNTQTRGWFYTLLVISTALFDEPAWKHLVVNGMVLAEDGKKMSKRLKNYPDPDKVFNLYGADAVRVYLCNSPVVRGETLKLLLSFSCLSCFVMRNMQWIPN